MIDQETNRIINSSHRYDWLNELNQTIEKIKNEKIIQNIYMCKNNEYNAFEI